MREMVADGEVDALVPERVWQELSRGLMEAQALAHVRGAARVRRAGARAARGRSPVRRAAARRLPSRGRHRRAPDDGARHGGAPRRPAGGALRLPRPRPRQGHDAGRGPAAPHRPRGAQRRAGAADERAPARRQRLQLARRGDRARARQRPSQRRVRRGGDRPPARSLRRLRRPDRFAELLLACECDARGRLGLEDAPYPQRARLLEALRLATAVDSTQVAADAAARGLAGPAIGAAILAARVRAVEALPPSPAT